MSRHSRLGIVLLAVTITAAIAPAAFALIMGGAGNEPVRDPGWPTGAAKIFNHPSRVAWWEGPPFGGGQYRAEYRGNAEKLNLQLEKFAKLENKIKRIVVYDGIGHSFWLNPNREKDKEAKSRIDWTFMVWQPDSWKRLQKMPARFRSREAGAKEEDGPPTEFEIYTGGSVEWKDVVVPEGVEVLDERLEAHGFAASDGTVLEGKVTDFATKKPMAAQITLERVEPQKTGGYLYPVANKLTADADGHWVLKNTPAAWYRIVATAEGYVPRVIGFGKFDDQPKWHSYNVALARPTKVTGRVTDEDDKPIADVSVRLDGVAQHGQQYDSPLEYKTKTDADGRFHFDQVPQSTASVFIHKSGYCRPGLSPTITTPSSDVALTMKRSGQLNVTVDFGNTKHPTEYIVELTPEGGNVVGSWGGSGLINSENKISFNDAPPGHYTLEGHPNPSSAKEATAPIAVELTGGETQDVIIHAIPSGRRK